MSAIAILQPAPLAPRATARADDTLGGPQVERSFPPQLEGEFWEHRRRANARQRRASLVLAVPLVAIFGIVDAYIAPEAKTLLWLIRFGVFMPVLLMVLAIAHLQPLREWSEGAAALGVFVAGGCVVALTLIAPLHYAGIVIVVFTAYTFLGLRLVYASSAGLAITMFYAVMGLVDGGAPWPVLATNTFFLVSCNLIGAFVCHVLEQAARRQFLRNHALSEQSQLSERLLRNVFPTSVAQRLMSRLDVIADTCPDVSILFADIVDFTPLAAAVAPERVVQLLDEIFSCFDRLAQAHGLEKIKTIGDAYMVAGGLRGRASDHVRAVAEMALDMLDSVARFDPGIGQSIALRIGIHTGPVVAGVIGRTKFAYDVWGDTVNVASRLESLTAPGTIMVSESTYERLQSRYVFSPRQVISVKGRGALPCYPLRGRSVSSRNQLVGARQVTPQSSGEAFVPAGAASFRDNAA